MTENSDFALSLWRSMRRYLSVSESPEADKIIVQNIALKSPLFPSIAFTNIVVSFTGLQNQRKGSHSRLQPGEEFEIELIQPLADSWSVDVTAQIDLDEFSKISVRSQASFERIRTNLSEWSAKFDQFDVFGRLDRLIGSIPEVSESSTIAEIKRLEALPDSIQSIFAEFEHEVGKHFPVDRQLSPYESVRSAVKSVGAYLRRISDAAKSNDVESIAQHLTDLHDSPDPSAEFEERRSLMLESLRDRD